MRDVLHFISCIALLLSWNHPTRSQETPRWATVTRDTLYVELAESGEIEAVKGAVVAAPYIWSQDMQIIEMVPEGSVVDSGEVIVRLDPTNLLNQLQEKQAELDIRQAELRRMQVEQAARIAELQRELELARHALAQAEVQLEQLKFESAARRDDGELEVLKARIALKEAESRLEAQKIIHASAIKKQELLILQARGEVARIQRQVDEMTLRAPIGGLVLYHTNWDGSKPQVGGKVNPGQGIIDLPDLSAMQVKVRVHEVDINKLESGMRAEVRLEAFPEKRFSATLVAKNVIADPLERNSQVRMFTAVLRIAETDSLLKPGMTARVHVGLDTLPDVLLIPVGCLFEIDGQMVVFTRRAPSRPVPVRLLGRTDFLAAVEGVDEGTEVGWQPGHPDARPAGYRRYMLRLRPGEAQRQQFFTEMEKRQLTFDYEAFRKHPPEPPGGAPGGTEAMLQQLGLPTGEMSKKGGTLILTPESVKKLRAGGKVQFEMSPGGMQADSSPSKKSIQIEKERSVERGGRELSPDSTARQSLKGRERN